MKETMQFQFSIIEIYKMELREREREKKLKALENKGRKKLSALIRKQI